MSPLFTSDITEYTAVTENNTNKIIATATDAAAEISIVAGGVAVDNKSAVTWQTGENIVKITVVNGDVSKEYTVTVTKQ